MASSRARHEGLRWLPRVHNIRGELARQAFFSFSFFFGLNHDYSNKFINKNSLLTTITQTPSPELLTR